MVLAYFMYKIAFDNRINYEYYYDNYMYNHKKAEEILVFETYDMITKLNII